MRIRRILTIVMVILLSLGAVATVAAQGQGQGNGNGAGPTTVTVGADLGDIWSDNVGSGQDTDEFTLAERGDLRIALRAQERSVGSLPVSGNRQGIYEASTGDTGGNNATWNYDWHIEVGEGDLGDYEITLTQNFSSEVFGSSNPVDLTFGQDLSGETLYQQSWNPGFGNDEFDPNAEGTYNLQLTVKPKDSGAPISVKIQVRVSD